MRMKIWIPMGLFAAATAVGGSSPALAQPRPPAHDDHKGPPDVRRDPRDDHRGLPDARPQIPDGRNDHPVLPPDRGQPDPQRDHFLQREEKEREHRKEERKDAAAWAANRKQRANDERKDIAATWGPLTTNSEAKAELALHADRMSRLNRVIDLAEDRNEPTVTARAKVLMEREIARDSRVMLALKAKVGAR
jgi:hypothetical protein